MSKIEKIFEIWSDLEESYSNLGKGKTRSEFMKQLVGYKSLGNHGINYILKQLIAEVESENSDLHMEKFSILTETFKCLSNYLDLNGVPMQIENLNAFLIEATGLSKELLTDKDLYSLYSKSEYDTYELPYKQMITRFRCVHDYILFVKDKSNRKKMVSSHYVGVENIADKFKVFHRDTATDFIMSNSKSNDSFILECAKVLSVLVYKKKVLEPLTCISSTDNIKDSLIFGESIEFVNTIKAGALEVAEFKLGETSIYCLCC